MSSTPTYVTSNEAKITVSVPGVAIPNHIKTWKSYSGGDPAAATSQQQLGAGISAVALPGPITRTPVVVGIVYTWALAGVRSDFEGKLNSACTMGYQLMDGDGNLDADNSVSRNGLLSKVEVGAFDAENGKAVILQLTMECNV